MSSTIIFAGLLIVLGHAFKVLFDKTRIPDIVPLVILGIIAGPVFHFLSPESFGIMGELLVTLALAIILFYSGLEVDLSMANRHFLTSTKLSVMNFVLSTLIIAFIVKYNLSLNLLESLIVGSLLSGISFAIVIPIVSKLNVSEDTKMILLVESTVSDVLCIVITLGLLEMIELKYMNPGLIIGRVVASFLMSSVIGGISAIFWTIILKWVRKLENDMLLTPSFIVIIFGLSEFLGYSGAIASLAFGLFAGNIKKLVEIEPFKKLNKYGVMEFNKREISIFSELVFILKVFFFFYIGLSMNIKNPMAFILGFIVAFLLIIVRFIPSYFMLDKKELMPFEKTIVSIMGPRGLVSAVLVSVAVKYDISHINLITEFVYSTILFTIIISAFMAFLGEHNKINFVSEMFDKS